MKITFFGAGRTDKTSKEYQDCIEIGKIIANTGHNLYTGGYGGLMEAISKGTHENGGKVHGIGCSEINGRPNNFGTFHEETSLFDRLHTLISGTDIFIVQVGGIGTLSELCLAIDFYRKQKSKPIFYLVGNFWKDIMQFIPKSMINYVHHVVCIQEFNLLLAK